MWEFVRQNEARILFLVDGYDELSDAESQSDVVKLIHGKLLRESCVLVTSRLDKSHAIQLECKQAKCFRIFGFSQNGTNKYVKEYFSNDKRKGIELNIEISQNDSILTEEYVTPLHVMFCCLLWDADVEILVLIISLYCKKLGISVDGKEIPEVVQADLFRLGKISLDGIQNNSVYFGESELRNQLRDDRIVRIGFLTKVSVKSRLCCSSHFTFTHKSFQEFVAAYFLTAVIRKLNKIPEAYRNVIDYPLLCSFLVGILQRESEPVFNLFRKNTVTEAVELETESASTLNFLATALSTNFLCTCQPNGYFNPISIYCMKGKLTQMFQMLNECTEDHESVIRTCAMALPTVINLFPLYFDNKRSAASLLKLLRVPGNPVQSIIYIFSELLCVILPIATLLETLNYGASVKMLHIGLETEYILANKTICEDISNFLKSNSTVCEMHLYIYNLLMCSDNPPLLEIKDTEVKAIFLCIEAIVKALSTNTSLRTLCLSGCLLDTECLQLLLEGMKHNTSLNSLVIRCMEYIGFDGWKALHDFLITTKTLKTLDVSGMWWEKTKPNSKTKTKGEGKGKGKEQDGLLDILFALERNYSLTEFVCGSSNLQQHQLQSLFKALKSNSNLTSLAIREVKDMKRGLSWFKTIFDHVKNTKIRKIDISAHIDSYILENLDKMVSEYKEGSLWAEIKEDCLNEIEAFITNNKSLKSLIMRQYKFPTVNDVTRCVSPGLRNNALQLLDLSSCCDGDGGDFLVRWSMSLVLDSPLERLILSGCPLKDSHMSYIASCIKTWSTTNCSLTLLDLSQIDISSAGSQNLADAMNSNPLCRRLKICLKPNLLEHFSRLIFGNC